MSYLKCSNHPSQTLEFYCEDCCDVVCMSCILSPQHRPHSDRITDAKSALDNHNIKLQSLINQANGCLQGAENIMDNLARCSEELKNNRSRAEQKIQRYFHRMRSILTDREHYFVSLLRQSVKEKNQAVIERRSKAKETTDGIINGLKALTDLLNRNDVLVLRDAVPIAKLLTKHFDTMNNHEALDEFKLDTSVTMPCFEDPNFEKVCRQVGDSNYRVCYNCEEKSFVSVNETISDSSPPPVPPRLSIKTKDSIDYLPPSPTGSNASTDSMDIFIDDMPPPIPPKSPKKTHTRFPQWIEDYKKQMEVAKSSESTSNMVHPVIKPRTKLKFKSEHSYTGGNEDHTSTTVVTVQPPTPSSPVNNLHSLEVSSKMMRGGLKDDKINPCSVCYGKNNSLIVADVTHHTVRILTGTGKFLDYVGQDELIDCPIAVTSDNCGNIFIADKSSLKVLKFTETGKFSSKFIYKSPHIGDLHGLVISHDGHVLASDWEHSCIHIFDPVGKYIKQFAAPESDLFQPTGLAFDNRGRLIVADRRGHHIWLFTPDGDLLSHFGWEGHNPGDLYLPYGIAVNGRGEIIVSESGNHRLSVFTDTGDFLNCFGEKGSDIGQFQYPLGICINANNKLVVCDEGNERLQIF